MKTTTTYFLFFVLSCFFASCSENTASSKKDHSLKIKNFSPQLIAGQNMRCEIKNNDFDAQQYLITENNDTLLLVNKPANELIFSLKNNKLGKRKLLLTATNKHKESINKVIMVEVFHHTAPTQKLIHLLNEHLHNHNNYTQGLFFDGDTLFESTGLYGKSKLHKYFIDKSPIAEKTIDEKLFGEGITLLQNQIYQLTWQSGIVLVYDRNFNLKKEIKLPFHAEGWGLTNNGTHLIMSDGTEKIRFLNPETMEIIHTLEVYDNKRKLSQLNELELVENTLYANIYQTNYLAEIDIETGAVLSYIDCSELVNHIFKRPETDVLNGIAYHSSRQSFYLTGKNWNKLFEVNFRKAI